MSPSDGRVPIAAVVIPALDAAATIERAIRSALSGVTVETEVIVVDDGSADGTPSIVARLAQSDPRIRMLRTERPRSGAGAARNRAFRAARGTWIALLDADDAFDGDRVGRLIAAAEQAGASVVADDVRWVGEISGGSSLTLFERRHLEVRAPTRLSLEDILRNDLGLLKPIFHRGLLEAGGLAQDEQVLKTEDFGFLFDLVAAGGLLLLPGATYHYHRGDAPTLSAASPDFWSNSARMTKTLLTRPASEDPKIRRLLLRRLSAALDRAAYLELRSDLHKKRPASAIRRVASRPTLVRPAFAALRQRAGLMLGARTR